MGTGKTSVGRKLAERLALPFYDIDLAIEQQKRMRVADIFEKFGEEEFRGLETKAFSRLVRKKACVIATGGKTLLIRKNLNAVPRDALVVCLTASPAAIFRRLRRDRSRPLLANAPSLRKRITSLMREREKHYKRLPNHIDTTGLSVTRVVEKILKMTASTKSQPNCRS